MVAKTTIFFLIIFFNTFSLYCQIQNNQIELIKKKDNGFWAIFYKPDIRTLSTNKVDSLKLLEFVNDSILILIEYENGIKTKATGYYSNKKLYVEAYFNKFGNHGTITYWYKSGKKADQESYKNGIQFSPIISWYESGSIKSLYDEENGFRFTWDSIGNINSKQLFEGKTKDNRIISTSYLYYPNGKIFLYSKANAGKQPFIIYFENGQKAKEGAISECELYYIGHWQEWYENGILSREYYFHDSNPNQKEGTWKWFDEKGNLTKEEYYKNGEKTGEKEYVPGKKGNEKMK